MQLSPEIEQIIQLIEQRTGLSTRTQHQTDLVSWLERLAGDDWRSYWHRLYTSDESAYEWQLIINALTIGETYFLRDRAHFRRLRDPILPQIILQRRQAKRLELAIGCVGCSTGEETYSIAATLYEFLPDLAQWQLTLRGTDINARAIDMAREGNYRSWSFRHTPEAFQQRYFTRTEQNTFQIKDFLREMVTFTHGNILTTPLDTPFDVIFCRNVLLYFGKKFIEQAENRMFNALKPGGWLILGQAETLRHARERWTMHLFTGTPIYQKPQATPTEPVRYMPEIQTSRNLQPPALNEDTAKIVTRTYTQAVRAIHTDQHDAAEQHLAAVLAYQPKHPRAHALLAFIFASRQAYPEAMAHIDTALKHDALLADAHYVRALLQIERQQPDEAIQSLQAALYSQRDHVLAAYTLGNLRARSGDDARAQRDWQNAQRALEHFAPGDYISDLSDLNAGSMRRLLQQTLRT